MESSGPPPTLNHLPTLNHHPMKFFRPLIKNKYIKSKNKLSNDVELLKNELLKNELSKDITPICILPTLKDCMYRIDNLEREIKSMIKSEPL
jgi:hypothetical protein